jgi:uncharacterized repeat protein (TIGR01451 family)
MSNSIPKRKHTKLRIVSILVLTIALIALVSTASTANATFESMSKQHTGSTFNVGDTITFTIILKVLDVEGGSPIAIKDVTINDTLPAGLTYAGTQSTTPPGAAFSQPGGMLLWTFGAGPFSGNPQVVVTFTATVGSGYTGYLVNRAQSNYTSVVNLVNSNPSTGDAVFVNTPPTPSPSPTVTPSPTPRQSMVGGEVAPVNILQLLAPYLAAAFIGAVAIASLVMFRKRTK